MSKIKTLIHLAQELASNNQSIEINTELEVQMSDALYDIHSLLIQIENAYDEMWEHKDAN